MKKMRIAMYVTNVHPIPLKKPVIYAPIELTQMLAEGMTKKGHHVTVFASSDSTVKAPIFSGGLVSLEKHPVGSRLLKTTNKDRVRRFFELNLISKLYQQAQKDKFDIIHIHQTHYTLPFSRLVKTPVLTTLHDPIEPWRNFIYSLYLKEKNVYYVSISNNQRKPMPNLNFIGTIYHGVDLKKYKFVARPENYFAHAGRLLKEKGTHLAIKVARQLNLNLKLAGAPAKGEYWEKEIKPNLNDTIKYLGLLKTKDIINLFGHARALLFPIQWEEPFGLVMIEAMAGGTPVIAFKRGSVPEIIKHGKTGFIVNNVREMVQAIKKIDQIDRRACREHVEKNFSLEKMVDEYEKTYQKVIELNKKRLSR